MANWIEPLNLETWLMQVFAGSTDIFSTIALIIIVSMAAYFRMNILGIFFSVAVFLLLFSGFITSPLLIFGGIVAGIIVGISVSKIVKG